MIVSFIIAGAGLVLAAVGLVLRKKLPLRWMASLLAAGILICATGSAFALVNWGQKTEDQQRTYLALCYLEQQRLEEADYYLKKVGQDTFVSVGARAVLEQMRGNPLIAQMKTDSLESLAKNEQQKTVALQISAVQGNDIESCLTAVAILRDQMGLSEKAASRFSERFLMETGQWVSSPQSPEGTATSQNEEEQLRISINGSMGSDNWRRALADSVALVKLRGSAENRLLLAEVIGECAYRDQEVSDALFADENGTVPDSIVKTREKLSRELETVQLRLDQLSLTPSEGEQALEEEKKELYQRQEELEQEYDFLFVYRAFNSIADLHSLEAEIVRARLYYAMRDYDQAVDSLLDAAGSLGAKFTPDARLRSALEILDRVYEQQPEIGTGSVEFRDAVATILSAGAGDMAGISASSITRDFSDYIVSEQKTYGQSLYVARMDLSQYPQVTVVLSGRETAVEQVLNRENVIAKDTRQSIQYEASSLESQDQQLELCCVVDQSGSMSGEPMANLQAALERFIGSLDEQTRLSLVGFSDSAQILAPSNEDHAQALYAAQQLSATGGTNITAGIQAGLEALAGREGGSTMLLMTDGQSDLNQAVVEEAAAKGVVIHTIGFGSVNDQLLQSIADATGGQYIRAESSTELVQVYASLVGAIGHSVQIRYQAPDQDNGDGRYFFLSLEDGKISVRLDYLLPREEEILPVLRGISPNLVWTEDLEQLAQQENATRSWTLIGENLSLVTGVTIGGEKMELVQGGSDTSLRIQGAPALEAGWQTIWLEMADGRAEKYDRLLAVGQRLGLNSFHLGNVWLTSTQTMILPDGTVVLGGSVRLRDVQEFSDPSATLDLSVSGLLFFSPDQPLTEGEALEQPVELGETGTLEGFGTVSLLSADSAYESQSGPLAQGAFLLDCTGEQMKIIAQIQEGGAANGNN